MEALLVRHQLLNVHGINNVRQTNI